MKLRSSILAAVLISGSFAIAQDTPRVPPAGTANIVLMDRVPDAEQARTQEPPVAELTVDVDNEGAGATTVQAVDESHYLIHMREVGYQNWFSVRVSGVPAGGKTIRFDLDNPNMKKLWSANPVYSYVTDLTDAATYPASPNAGPTAAEHLRGSIGGSVFPDDPKQPWRFIGSTWRTSPTQLSFVHRFEKDGYVSLRVPYGVGYHTAFMKSLAGNANVKIYEIAGHRDALSSNILEIGGSDAESRKKNPCVVIYAREDGDQVDGSWFVEGIVRHLSTDTPEAKALREKCTFLLIPMIDPNAVLGNHWADSAMSFGQDDAAETMSNSYKKFFKQRAEDGNRLDVVIDLFTPESAEYPHLGYIGLAGILENKQVLCKTIEAALQPTNLYVSRLKPGRGDKVRMPNRLVGWVSDTFGATPLAFFVNSQDKGRHLALDETRRLGVLVAGSLADCLTSPAGAGVLKSADDARQAVQQP